MPSDRDAICPTGEPAASNSGGAVRLVVFSDDFGRHPSSCQHLVRQLLKMGGGCCGCGGCSDYWAYRVLWVNTIGTRRPGVSLADLSRAAGKLRGWAGGADGSGAGGAARPENLTVISPKMWPGFRRPWQRGFNARSITRAVHEALGPRRDGERRIAITTLPITADLVGPLDVDRWVYYCVDDFSVWPGLDSGVMQTMERELVGKVDEVVAVSQTLQQRIAGMGKAAGLLTHGVDTGHWSGGADRLNGGGADNTGGDRETSRSRKRLMGEGRPIYKTGHRPAWWPDVAGPVALFWGLIDRRLDIEWCEGLADELERRGGALVLAGPQQSPDARVAALPGVVLPGPVAYDELPGLAALAEVLVMPYIDAPVTRAMQPLKLKEYLATGKPVVVRDLPATGPWSDAADVVGDVGAFVQAVMERAGTGLPIGQAYARGRLSAESWSQKAQRLASVFADEAEPPMKRAA